MSTPQETMFEEALSAIDAGERARARDLLTRLLKTGQDNPDYWLWMSVVVESPRERAFCLKEVLRLNPESEAARRGLAVLGAMPPDQAQVMPARYFKRNWQKNLFPSEKIDQPAGSRIQFALMGVVLVILMVVGGLVFWGTQRSLRERTQANYAFRLPTSTITPTAGITPSATVDLSTSPTPLWMLLKATYTPTALYVNTPHPISESYRIGLRAYQNGEWDKVITYMAQAEKDTNGAPDIIYFLGEAYRQQGKHERALEEFERLIEQQPDFAVAYLGRARTMLATDPGETEDVMLDLQTAIEKDPGLSEAYLELASLQLAEGNAEEALAGLERVAEQMPDSPMVYLYRAKVYIQLGETEKALEDARKANELDFTLLPAYRMIGEVLQVEGELHESIEYLNTYIRYEPDDALAWVMLARAYMAEDENEKALESLNRAMSLKALSEEALLARAEILLEEGMAEKALKDYEAVLRVRPKSFVATLGVGKALMGMDYPGDAWKKFEESLPLAKTDMEKAERLVWLAQSLEALDEPIAATNKWKELLAMPEKNVKPEWIEMAEKHMSALRTSTPTAKPKTPTLSPTSTSTRWPTKTPTPTITRKPTLTKSATPTRNP